MVDLDAAWVAYCKAYVRLSGFHPAEIRDALKIFKQLIEECRDARAALGAPEVHWDCKQREEKLALEVRELRTTLGALSDTSNYSIPGGRST